MAACLDCASRLLEIFYVRSGFHRNRAEALRFSCISRLGSLSCLYFAKPLLPRFALPGYHPAVLPHHQPSPTARRGERLEPILCICLKHHAF